MSYMYHVIMHVAGLLSEEQMYELLPQKCAHRVALRLPRSVDCTHTPLHSDMLCAGSSGEGAM